MREQAEGGTVKITFVLPSGEKREIAARAGQSLMEAARDNGLPVEGTCGGNMACCTCHMIVDRQYFNALPRPSAEERGMLDLAVGLRPTSRLGCQIRITESIDGIVLTLPE